MSADSVLCLSIGFEPVAIVPWERAMTLLVERKAELVEARPDKVLRSAHSEWEFPSIIRFVKAARSRKKAIKFSRESIYARDRGTCQFCGTKVSRDSFTYDHVIPRIQSGRTEWQNIVVSCQRCNLKKAGRTPDQAGMRLLSKPVKPKSLPQEFLWHLQFRPGIHPESWRQWLRSSNYWIDELEHD